ncbi:shugoshin c terminal domain-containing protein [Colletotrichum sojae]|uniref:Shugoshin c terminal domain-containing protein n=1 Tax=Colletotrichum sojae TaxID=2175907 RepID=A0A8H6JYX4_9PEZI|nr:shugoshin c terminal domain-containing protein [Colletotrichum sojae]
MARLNEPPVSADSIDTLRRKLLRQNRDLAKANAAHLVKIRNLEADYARFMSENLSLNSKIIELQTELENNNARRIADHALDVRARVEAQLMDCLSALSSLGQEPPTKRHASPRGRRSTRASLPRSPPERRPPREFIKDTEARALQEGRLPPIAENKSYPRATLDADKLHSREQILALCSEAADSTDTTDSPELGPPPISRFVDGESVNIGSPSKSVETARSDTVVPGSPAASPSLSLSPSPAPPPPPAVARPATRTEKNIHVRPDPTPETESEEVEAKRRPKETPILPPVVPQVSAKAGSKRKYSVGEDTSKTSQKTTDTPRSRHDAERPVIGRELQNAKSLKELTNQRKEARERLSAPVNPRKPLSAKSTNDDVTSPIKNTKVAAAEGKAVADKPKPRAARERAAQKIREAEVNADTNAEPPTEEMIENPSSPTPTVDILPSTEPVPVEAALMSPASPELTSRMSLPSVRDTPPPADISSQGETSRPSRRARSAISYAEPNLRDKMRRPTKELYDAVSGQTRYLQRGGSSKSDSATPDATVMDKRESNEGDTWGHMPVAASSPATSPRRLETSDELQLRELAPIMSRPDRKKRSSSMMSRSISETEAERSARQAQTDPQGEVNSGHPTPSPDREVDPYDIISSTPGSNRPSTADSKENALPQRQSKSSRRLSSVVKEDFKIDESDVSGRPRASSSRKRASMALPKRSRVDAEGSEDSSFESLDGGELQDAGSRVSVRRRRSMML